MRRKQQQERIVREEKIQEQICNWMKIQYPRVIFTCDLSSGMRLTIGQAVKATKMRSSRGLPDLMIFEPRGPYSGMMLELKRKDKRVYKQDGQLIADPHVREQAEILKRLQVNGYCAMFACGFEQAAQFINRYLAIQPLPFPKFKV